MPYEIGDTVVHWTHGLGKVVAIDQIEQAGALRQYYVVEVGVLKLWVTVEDADLGSIRLPTESVHFDALFEILRGPGNPLPDNQYQRKLELRQRIQKRTPEDLCQLIRDLTDWASRHTLNAYDASVLFRAEEALLDEWVLSLGVERASALRELEGLLGRGG